MPSRPPNEEAPDTSRYECAVLSREALSGGVLRIRLAVPQAPPISFAAGQYLKVHAPDGTTAAYSIASRPQVDNPVIELHVRPRGLDDGALDRLITSSDRLDISLPYGRCALQGAPTQPTLFVAASTGFAQMKAMLEFCFEVGLQAPLYLYWGGSCAQDLYLQTLPEAWSGEVPDFHFVPVVSGPEPEWTGRTGLLHSAIRADFSTLQGCGLYLSGSPQMVYGTVDGLSDFGLAEADIHADVFDYAPKDP